MLRLDQGPALVGTVRVEPERGDRPGPGRVRRRRAQGNEPEQKPGEQAHVRGAGPAQAAATILTDLSSMRSAGVLFSAPPVGTPAMRSRTSSPPTSSPKAVYWRSRNLASP